MQYYMIEWDHEEPDEPWRLFLEMDRTGSLCRKVEAFRVGVYESYEELDTPPMDPRELAGSEGNLRKITRAQFDEIWEQSRQMRGGFMGMFY